MSVAFPVCVRYIGGEIIGKPTRTQPEDIRNPYPPHSQSSAVPKVLQTISRTPFRDRAECVCVLLVVIT